MNRTIHTLLFLIGAIVSLAACNSTSVRTTDHTRAVSEPELIPEDQLLDVGIDIFNPGIDTLSEEKDGVFPEVRNAEARYMPYKLMETLQRTGNWGIVRVVPNRRSEMDLWVNGEILQSDGEILALRIKVTDASGRIWYTRTYKETASKYAYDDRRGVREEPFQGLYNRIANDMASFRRHLDQEYVKNLRTITELKFAREFAPDAYNDHLESDGKGHYKIKRLPAENDPILQRVKRIRERDYMFVDTMQDYYASFTDQMEEPYRSWRRESYHETMALRELKQKSTGQILAGVAAVAAGILGAASDSDLAQVAGVVGIGAGAYLVKEGIDTRKEAKIHAEALKELGASLNAEVQPHTITLEDRTVTLSGTVDDQYGQWRMILREIYLTETGQSTTITN